MRKWTLIWSGSKKLKGPSRPYWPSGEDLGFNGGSLFPSNKEGLTKIHRTLSFPWIEKKRSNQVVRPSRLTDLGAGAKSSRETPKEILLVIVGAFPFLFSFHLQNQRTTFGRNPNNRGLGIKRRSDWKKADEKHFDTWNMALMIDRGRLSSLPVFRAPPKPVIHNFLFYPLRKEESEHLLLSFSNLSGLTLFELRQCLLVHRELI